MLPLWRILGVRGQEQCAHSLPGPRIGALAGNPPPLAEEEWPGGALTTDLSARVNPPLSALSAPPLGAGPRQPHKADSESRRIPPAPTQAPPCSVSPFPPRAHPASSSSRRAGLCWEQPGRATRRPPCRPGALTPGRPVTDVRRTRGPSRLTR